jgi:hypothetical protein
MISDLDSENNHLTIYELTLHYKLIVPLLNYLICYESILLEMSFLIQLYRKDLLERKKKVKKS